MRKLIAAVFIALIMVLPAQANPPAPTNTISNPRIVLHKKKHMVQVKWFQYAQVSPKLVIAFKITNYRRSGLPECTDVDWAEYLIRTTGFKYCYDLFNARLDKNQWITVIDENWHNKDQYYIIQYDFTSHNAPYGPFIAK